MKALRNLNVEKLLIGILRFLHKAVPVQLILGKQEQIGQEKSLLL